MTTELYVPNLATAESAYVHWVLLSDRGIDAADASDEFDRFVAKIKADALRSAANAFAAAEVNLAVIPPEDRNYWRECNQERVRMVSSLRRRADRIEGEA